jgi:hypothetical protein
MQRAKRMSVGLEFKRAGVDAPDGVDGGDDGEEGNSVRRGDEREAAMLAALRRDDARAGEGVEDLGEIVVRDACDLRDLEAGERSVGILSESDGSAEGVFSSAGDHRLRVSLREQMGARTRHLDFLINISRISPSVPPVNTQTPTPPTSSKPFRPTQPNENRAQGATSGAWWNQEWVLINEYGRGIEGLRQREGLENDGYRNGHRR